MSHLISGSRIVPVYFNACEELLQQRCQCFNLVLEIAEPNIQIPQDRASINEVSTALVDNNCSSITTVANTIFPQQLYDRSGYPGVYGRFDAVISRFKKKGTWGTYFQRLTAFPGKNGKPINQLELAIYKLLRSVNGKYFSSIYELNVSGIGTVDMDIGTELLLYSPHNEGRKISNMPCMSHLSLKLDRTVNRLHLTAVYRSQYYGSKALGNLIGLARLQKFICDQIDGIQPGVMTCIATEARLDVEALGGMARSRTLLLNNGNNP